MFKFLTSLLFPGLFQADRTLSTDFVDKLRVTVKTLAKIKLKKKLMKIRIFNYNLAKLKFPRFLFFPNFSHFFLSLTAPFSDFPDV